MSSVKVSVIIPFHNVQDYIKTSLESVLKQTLKDIEIICINDKSDDNSLEIVKDFMSKDSRIKLINISERKGQGYARNLGLNQATGEYIGFVDSDDWVNEVMFEKLYNRASEFNSDISMCKTILFDEQNQKEIYDGYYQLENLKDFKDRSFCAFDVSEDILNVNVAIWNKIYRREFLVNSEIKFPEGFIFEDLPFFFETYLNGENISIVDENLYYYRINRQGSTMQNIGVKVCDRIDMLELSYKHIQHYYGFDETETNVLNWLVEDIFHRASIIESGVFGQYFDKAKAFLRKIGFVSKDEMKDKGIIFLDEVLFWLNLTPDDAMFFIRTFRTTDKKLDKLYSELGKVYSYSDYKFQTTKDEVDKLNLKLGDFWSDFDFQKEKLEEYKNSFSSEIRESVEQIKTSNDNWSKYYNEELKQLYNNMTSITSQTLENADKLLAIQKEDILNIQNQKQAEIEQKIEQSDLKLEGRIHDKIDETFQILKSQFEEEKRELKEEFDKKLNEQRVKYERKLIKIEEDYEYFYKKLEPVIKFLKFLGINREKK